MSPTPGGAASAHELFGAIATIVGDVHVRSSAEHLIGLGARPGGAPAWVVRPGSAAEVAGLINLAGQHDIAVIPVGNQARAPRAQALSERKRMFIDTRRMNHVVNLDETSLMTRVQAGITALELEEVLAPRGLSVGDYPPVVLGSTIGGLLSVRTPGKSSPRHGFVEEAVLGISAVLATGRAIHTRVAPRRSTGPDLARALCGSEGTLGIITSAVLRIHRVPEARYLSAYAMPDFATALAAVHLSLREEAAPSALRAYDSAEARAHFGPDKWPGSEAVLVAATAGPTALAACDRDLIASAAQAMGGRVAEPEIAQMWWRQRTGQGDDRPPLPSLQITAAPSKQAAVYHAVCEAAGASGRAARAHASRFDCDGAVFFFTFTDAAGQRELADSELAGVRSAAEEAARKAGAVLLDSGNPSLAAYLDELRRAIDPRGIMNPGALRPTAGSASR